MGIPKVREDDCFKILQHLHFKRWKENRVLFMEFFCWNLKEQRPELFQKVLTQYLNQTGKNETYNYIDVSDLYKSSLYLYKQSEEVLHEEKG